MRGTFREAARVKVAAPPLSPVPSPTLPPPTNPSKEYIYAGGRLIATEEPSKADQTITFSAISDKTYGDAPFTLSATASSGLAVSFTVVAGAASVSGSTLTITGAGPVTIKADQAGSNGYNSAPPVTQSFMVNKATAVITLGNLSQTYDGTAKFASATTTPAGLSVSLTYSQNGQNVSAPTNAGSYPVTATINDSNYQGTTSNTLVINKATATVSLSGLTGQVYDGTAKSASATTTPANLSVNIAYTQNGQSVSSPTSAGSYAATATINETNYQGGATGTLVIDKASQTISFSALANKTYGDAPFSLSASSSSGLSVSFSIVSGPATISSGSTLTITGAGTVTVRASQAGTGDYSAAANVDRSFNVAKATATVTLGNLSQTYDGTVKSATASTTPPGLNVSFTYIQNGQSISPINAGSYTVSAVINDSNFQGSATPSTLVISKATATVTLSNLSYTYNGNAHFASASTNPANLSVIVSYSQGGNNVSSPTNAGSYSVAATINETNYEGSATPGTLVISKATPSISWSNPADIPETTPLSNTQLNATTSVQGTFVYNYPLGTVLDIGNNQELSTTFTPNDTANYNNADASVHINVIGCPRNFRSTFTANPVAILPGNQSTLSWDVPYATSVSIGGINGTFNSTGSTTVSPSTTTSYTLTAGGASICSSLTMQTQVGVCPTVSGSQFTASHSLIVANTTIQLNWNVPRATSVSIAGVGTFSTSSGSTSVTPSATTTYTLTAIGAAGCSSTTLQTTVTVQACPDETHMTFSADQGLNPFGEIAVAGLDRQTYLWWDAPNSTAIRIYVHGLCPPDVGVCLRDGETVRARITSSTSTSGSVTIDVPEETTTYDMFVDGAYGCQTLMKQITVEVEPTAGNCSPNAFFNVDYSPFGSAHCPAHGTDVDLIWDVPNATSVEITDEFGNSYGTFGPSDSISVSPPTNTTFILTAYTNYTGDCASFTMETTLEYCGSN